MSVSRKYLNESTNDKEGTVVGRMVAWAFLKWDKALFNISLGTTKLQKS